MSFSGWSTDNASNVTVGGISIAENCPAANVNNALREIMAEVRAAFNPALDVFQSSANLADAQATLRIISRDGDTMLGPLFRYGAGVHLYHTNPGFISGRVFFTAVGASDPTSQPGDIWITGS